MSRSRRENETLPPALAPADGSVAVSGSGGEMAQVTSGMQGAEEYKRNRRAHKIAYGIEVTDQPRSRLAEMNLPLSSRNRGNRFMASQCPSGKLGAAGRAGLISATGTPLFSITTTSPDATRFTTNPVRRCSSRMFTPTSRLSHVRAIAEVGFVYTEIVYTLVLLDGVKGFDWDLHNVGHVDRHGVDPAEVEEAIGRPHLIVPARESGGEKRWKLFGTSARGRYLVVVFTIRDDRLRPVTAHTMNQRERKIYAPEIDKTA